MTHLVRRSILIALIPSLAIAAPRGRKKPRRPDPVVEPAPAPEAAGSADAARDAKAAAPTPPPATPSAPAAGTTPGSGGATGADKPAEPATPPAAADPDVDTLRQEYLSLRDELFKSRARANTVASQLYSTRVQIKLTYTTARYYSPGKASIRLDGANVYEDSTGAIAGDDGVRFDGYVAPGRHLVTFHVEATGKDDDSFTSTTETQIVVKAVAGKDLVVAARAKDSGDIAYEWKRNEHGSYGLGIDVGVKTTARAGAGETKGAGK